jgi:ubiquinone/menaquinone biosynthesis C-methylase UbiE
MLEVARGRLSGGSFVRGDALALPFEEATFGRVFSAHFYGHLHGRERQGFLTEVRRVAGELVVVDAALRPDKQPEELQERVLSDGSRHEIYKRYFDPAELAEELGGGQVLFSGAWFVVVAA